MTWVLWLVVIVAAYDLIDALFGTPSGGEDHDVDDEIERR